MSKPRNDFEMFVAETLLREFLEQEIKSLKAQQKMDQQITQQKVTKGKTGIEKFKQAAQQAGSTKKIEPEEKKTGTIGNTPEKLTTLKTADANWKQVVAYSRNVTKLMRSAMSKMQADDAGNVKKAGALAQSRMKAEIGKQFTKITSDIGGDALTAKATLMSVISQVLQDLETGK